jgi:hypothetical protein
VQSNISPRGLCPSEIAFVDISSGECEDIIAFDRRSLEGLFRSARSAPYPEIPKCNVLFLYLRLRDDGSIVGASEPLRDLIGRAGSQVAVVASENSSSQYVKAAAGRPGARANLVMTLERKGEHFARFFAALFVRMNEGATMEDAWLELSPQVQGSSSLPDTIFSCELPAVRWVTASR